MHIPFRVLATITICHAMLGAASTDAATYKALLLVTPNGQSISQAYGAWNHSQVGYRAVLGEGANAVWWNSTADSLINIHPINFDSSEANDAYGDSQVGFGRIGVKGHALLWHSSAESVVDLHPIGFSNTYALATNGSVQVGNGDGMATQDQIHALMWSGSAESVVDLNPQGFFYSVAEGVTSTHQYGYGDGYNIQANYHALMWSGSPESVIDLNPPGFTDSLIKDASETYRVGWGSGLATNGLTNALMWHGEANNVVNLNPVGMTFSVALGTSEHFQVGHADGMSTQGTHAFVWAGSPESAVDLHTFLGGLPFSASNSYALDVDDFGNIVGFVEDEQGRPHAVIWVQVPEPCSSDIAGLAFFSIAIGIRGRSAIRR